MVYQYLIPLCCQISFHCMNLSHLSIYQLMDIWVVSTLWLFWTMLLWAFVYMFLCGNIFSFLLYICLLMKLLEHGNSLYNIFFKGTVKPFPSGCSILPPAIYEASNFSMSLQTFIIFYCFVLFCFVLWLIKSVHCAFDLDFLTTNKINGKE